MDNVLVWLLVPSVAVGFLLVFKIYRWTYREAPPEPLRRTQTLTYSYSATATVQSQYPTYLAFPAPPLPRHGPAAQPTILKDFTVELRNIGIRCLTCLFERLIVRTHQDCSSFLGPHKTVISPGSLPQSPDVELHWPGIDQRSASSQFLGAMMT